MFPLVSGVAMLQAPALSVDVRRTNPGLREFIAQGIIGEEQFPIETDSAAGEGNGRLIFTGTGSGGDGSYAFAWTVEEEGDDNNIASGNIFLSVVGTQNVAVYNTARLKFVETGLSGGGPPIVTTYKFRCTVTDGTGATATAFVPFTAVLVPLA